MKIARLIVTVLDCFLEGAYRLGTYMVVIMSAMLLWQLNPEGNGGTVLLTKMLAVVLVLVSLYVGTRLYRQKQAASSKATTESIDVVSKVLDVEITKDAKIIEALDQLREAAKIADIAGVMTMINQVDDYVKLCSKYHTELKGKL